MNRFSRGFTLMEVVTAMGMLSAALGASMYTSNMIGKTFSINRRMTKAHDIAALTLEELLATYDSDSKLTDGAHTQLYDDEGRKVGATGTFTATWTIRHNVPITKIIEIILTVSWVDDGHTRAVHYTTYRST